MSTCTVVVLMGGPDAERDVSIQSGAAVASALERTGKYVVQKKIIDTPSLQEIENIEADVVFPVLHGPFGEGGPLQELLEHAQKTFVGSTGEAASMAMNKETTKQIAFDLGIQTPQWCIVTDNSNCSITPPVVLKPINDGSSYGVTICKSSQEVLNQQEILLEDRNKILAESYIEGRELTVGIIGGKPLPIVEIIVSSDLDSYDYEAKYERDDTQFIIEPILPINSCVKEALSLYGAMGIRDIARVDFILTEKTTWFLELNTMPGFTNHSLLPMAAKHAGMDMCELCNRLVEFALQRQIKS